MNIEIQPHKLIGTVKIPSSKSMAHRMLICAALSKGISEISEIDSSKDIEATISVMQALGAVFEFREAEHKIIVTGIQDIPGQAHADCNESGSTLRFLIPVAAALGVETTFTGQGRLPERPITPYIRELTKKNIRFQNQKIPFTIQGKLQPGRFELEGDISSQFITGLLLALPLLRERSEIILTSPLQSKPYADMTIQCMQQFGVSIKEKNGNYYISGTQQYHAQNLSVEGDFSQAAFFYVANAIGNQVILQNIPETSTQGDRRIVEIIEKTCYHQKTAEDISETVSEINARDIPDLVPILAVLATFSERPTRIIGAERLRIKESDRLATTASMLNTLGGNVKILPDGLEIQPVDSLHGGTVDSAGDHRIAMCAAIAATRATEPVTILGAECVAKSYPAFFQDYQKLGGKIHGIHLE
ncbi:MAG: 3-phosphoshikimate 1-carboxyvinyltransferase [Oscillospiraceae bacterium]|nr:3-phosphoshikimate 1-carboxyvinyltransferase [Oscillospiraceae bacterium]